MLKEFRTLSLFNKAGNIPARAVTPERARVQHDSTMFRCQQPEVVCVPEKGLTNIQLANLIAISHLTSNPLIP